MVTRRPMRRRRIAPARVEEKRVEITCAFCQGTGKDPFHVLSILSACPVCHGRGKVRVEEPYETCAACEGTGLYFNSRLYCWTCKGKGVVPVKEARRKEEAEIG